MPAPASRRPKQARQKPITAQATESFDEDEEFSGDPKELTALFQQGLLRRLMGLIKEGGEIAQEGARPAVATQLGAPGQAGAAPGGDVAAQIAQLVQQSQAAPGGSPETAVPAQRVPNSGITQQQVQPPQALPPPTRGERFVAAASPAAGQLVQQSRSSQFNSQQSAFQQAMQNQRAQDRNEALGSAGGRAQPFGQLRTVTLPDGSIGIQEFIRDPATGEFTAGDVVAAGVDPARLVDTDRGKRRFRSKSGVLEDDIVVKKPVTPAEAKSTQESTSLPFLLNKSEELFRELTGPGGVSTGERIGTSLARDLPLVGGKVEELILSRTSPRTVNLARNLDNVADILLRLRSGAQINEKEFQRLRALLPKTGEGVESALKKFSDFRAELMTLLRTKAELQPALFTDEILRNTVGMTRDELLLGRLDSVNPAGNTDDILRRLEAGEELTDEELDAAEAAIGGG